MTVLLPLDPQAPFPQFPAFLSMSPDAADQTNKAIQAIMKAKRIVVICGAGISVQAGIPDFRSEEGLFKTLKRDNPREALASGKDLFDASVFNSEHTMSLFCQMIAQLSELSQAAQPTVFHQLLRDLDQRGKLLRVYTQNIDAIEQKCGLTFGVPENEGKRPRSRPKGKSIKPQEDPTSPTEDATPSSSCSRVPSPEVKTPRCVPLHGTLQTMHCQICNHHYPLQEYLPALGTGQPPECPECTALEETRQLVGKRPRGIGKLRPSVVLYNEAHKDGEGVGEVVRKDLIGSSKGKGRSGADLLLVVGTSLRVPGTKRMVREFAKAVRSRRPGPSKDDSTATNLSTPTPSPRRTPATDEEPSFKALYLNMDFPVPTREWEGVFDAWIQGDAQLFAQKLRDEMDKEARAKEVAIEKRRRREEEAVIVEELSATSHDITETKTSSTTKKRKAPDSTNRTVKHRKIVLPPTPPKSPSPRNRPKGSVRVQDRPKLILRIPPRPRSRHGLIPEVLITTPSTPKIARQPLLSEIQLPPTPDEYPRPNKRTKAGRRAVRAARALRKSNKSPTKTARKKSAVDLEMVADGDDSDDSDALPETFVRNVQYGLRG